jgi:2-keto-4-pentenoate hydratase/2-oxohepta-3-ene-1,7-dioic acid hydratase in catechol pathway
LTIASQSNDDSGGRDGISFGNEELHAVAGALAGREADGTLEPSALGAPVPRPQKVFGVGLNYRSHAEESKMEIPTTPLIFTKFPNCLTGPAADVVLFGPTTDWEAELVVVLGQRGRDIPADKAWKHVAGLTCGQDISERRTQFASKPPQFSLGKSYDTFGPIGPFVVSLDSFSNPDDLALTCDVNGERKQEARTSDLIFPVPELIAYLSSIMTLEAGDIIFTGTPAGVGAMTRTFLQPGDVITTEIEGIGIMRNTCVARDG